MNSQIKKLYRSETEKVIAGVCGGLGEYFEIDPIIFRALFVILALLNGGGVLIYIILIFIIPSEGKQAAGNFKEDVQKFAQKIKVNKHWFGEKRNLIALIIIAIGFLSLLHQLFPSAWINIKTIGPMIIILVGLFIIFKNKKNG